MRKILVVALIGLLLISTIEGAKKGAKEQKGKKGGKEEKGAKAEKAKEPKAKAEKQKAQKAEEPVAEAEEAEDPALDEAFLEEPSVLCPYAAAAGHGAHPPADATHARLVKPKSLKVLSEYEQCKMECKKQRDQVTAQQYVEQLKGELASAEQALHEQALAIAAAVDHPVDTQTHQAAALADHGADHGADHAAPAAHAA